MLLTLADLRSEIKVRLKEPGLSNAQLDLWANLAQDHLTSELDPDHLIITSTFATVASTRTYYLDLEFNKLLSLVNTDTDTELTEETESRLETWDPDRVATGTPSHFAQTGLSWVSAQPTSASVITIVSSDTSDTSENVRINGLVSGEPDTELLTLNGTTSVAGTKSFTEVFDVTKDAVTTGRVTVTSNSAAVTVVTLGPNEKARAFQPVILYPVPTAAETIRYRAIRAPRPLVNAEDHPDFPPLYHELVLITSVYMGHLALYNFEQAKEIKKEYLDPRLDNLKRQQANKRRKRSPILRGQTYPQPLPLGRLPDRDI